ncbi:MAG TPA: hypothetical protein PLS21_02045 [Synergistales bacterium]|nr:hypothetical protein [Synergistales bacterium]HQO82756.1 hypothetical protein [Synergistales bacterium]HQQ10886.1 hypothetical protein [Synergistales bacterium]
MENILSNRKLLDIFWSEYGFEEWSGHGLKGVFRRVTFRKDSLMGEVARYYSDDYILSAAGGNIMGRELLEVWKPGKDIMSHRVLLVGNTTWQSPLHKDFLLGFSGWVEVMCYRPGDPHSVRKFSDLTTLVNNAGVVLAKLEEGLDPMRVRVPDPGRRGVAAGEPRNPAPFEVLKKLLRR